MARQAADPGGVVAVFVREKNGVDAVKRLADPGQQLPEAAGRKTGIDEDAGLGRLQQGTIAVAAAAEDAEPHAHWVVPDAMSRTLCEARAFARKREVMPVLRAAD